MNILKKIYYILVIIGALNWGLIGLFNFNLVTAAFGSASSLINLTYIIIGISALLLILMSGFSEKENKN